ncbi:GNAT family N-acetyltransferase [Chengkuizengella axinellae]|uniref:GNAT family N-acetyltransferase n=1 Tax=Chengkuizengella axinellae TaxID=3064388 RepID=A0ABT9IW16_9BACL|nr:GNAT family N-acetyltransferase [Chengkuizengella sp. 2205SS18-9]MDP5273541.1 GNAT family N-acetyltransferase [Chengkuizengella sp. 2205SS18-9]
MLHSQQKLTQIKELQEICEKEEPISLKLNWDNLRTRKVNEKRDFFYEEKGELVGFLGLYLFGTKIEVCGMVHPDYRKRGIFSTLIQEALTLCDRERFSTILLNAPASSLSAKQFLENKYSYRFSEFQMQWKATSISPSSEVVVRKAKKDDLELEVELDVRCFQFSEEESKSLNARVKGEENRFFYMIDYTGQTIGKITVDRANGEAWIYGFAILPEYQGRGIGRKALMNTVLAEHEKGYPVFLEVEATNKNALKLYTDCGFESYSVQDYYEVRR